MIVFFTNSIPSWYIPEAVGICRFRCIFCLFPMSRWVLCWVFRFNPCMANLYFKIQNVGTSLVHKSTYTYRQITSRTCLTGLWQQPSSWFIASYLTALWSFWCSTSAVFGETHFVLNWLGIWPSQAKWLVLCLSYFFVFYCRYLLPLQAPLLAHRAQLDRTSALLVSLVKQWTGSTCSHLGSAGASLCALCPSGTYCGLTGLSWLISTFT